MLNLCSVSYVTHFTKRFISCNIQFYHLFPCWKNQLFLIFFLIIWFSNSMTHYFHVLEEIILTVTYILIVFNHRIKPPLAT